MNTQSAKPNIDPRCILEALKVPNGFVYQIVGTYSENEFTPPGAILGAWKVDARGQIIPNSWMPNPNFREDIKNKRFNDLEQYNQWILQNPKA